MKEPTNPYSRELLRDIIEWDVASWQKVLAVWDRGIENANGKSVLDVGARCGGLSLYFALKGCTVVCSDLDGPAEDALELHKKHGVSERVSYRKIDATKIEYPDNEFDIVCFKSILGGIGRNDNLQRAQQAVSEIHRVLRPGGKVLFAENLKATFLHVFLRRSCIRWGTRWRYMARDELRSLFAIFADLQLHCYDCLAAFGRSERLRSVLHAIDVVIDPLVPQSCWYIAFGCATK